MSEPEVRLCTKDDLAAMARLRMMQKTHAGARVTEFASVPITHIPQKYLMKQNAAVGYFEDGKLKSFICASSSGDFWVLDLMISSGDPKTLRLCLQKCLELFEERGITQFYYAFPEKWARAYRSFWKDGSPLLRRYTIEDVAVIEARKRPNDPFLWEHILKEVVVPVPFLVRRSYVQKSTLP